MNLSCCSLLIAPVWKFSHGGIEILGVACYIYRWRKMNNANAQGTHYIPKQTVAKLTMDKSMKNAQMVWYQCKTRWQK